MQKKIFSICIYLVHCSRYHSSSSLSISKQIKEGLIHQANLIAQASKEVEQFCDDHNWVAEIHEVVSSWGNGPTDSWRGQPAIKIEVIRVNSYTTLTSIIILSKFFP